MTADDKTEEFEVTQGQVDSPVRSGNDPDAKEGIKMLVAHFHEQQPRPLNAVEGGWGPPRVKKSKKTRGEVKSKSEGSESVKKDDTQS